MAFHGLYILYYIYIYVYLFIILIVFTLLKGYIYMYIYIYRKVRSASVLGSMVMFSAYKLQSVKPDLPQNVIPIAAVYATQKNKLNSPYPILQYCTR